MLRTITTDIAIIGGGILGCAIAESLAGEPGLAVTVFERHGLGEQTTSHAAALLTRARPDHDMSLMVAETFLAVTRLSEALDAPLPLRRVGSLHVSDVDDGRDQLAATAQRADELGYECRRLTPEQAEHGAPWLKLGDAASAIWLPDDGYIDPYQLCAGYAQSARRNGARFELNAPVRDIERVGHRITGLVLADGRRVAAGLVIDAAGPWSTALARNIGVNLAMGAVRSHYWISAPDSRVPADGPMVILPDSRGYARPEVGGLLFGLRDAEPVYTHPGQLPEHLGGFAFDRDSDGLAALEAGSPALARQCPMINDTPLAHYISNISSYTPDGKPLIGALPGLDGFMAATGCSGAGIGLSGGIARLVADLALERTPHVAAGRFRLDRFGSVDPYHTDFQIRCARARSLKRTG